MAEGEPRGVGVCEVLGGEAAFAGACGGGGGEAAAAVGEAVALSGGAQALYSECAVPCRCKVHMGEAAGEGPTESPTAACSGSPRRAADSRTGPLIGTPTPAVAAALSCGDSCGGDGRGVDSTLWPAAAEAGGGVAAGARGESPSPTRERRLSGAGVVSPDRASRVDDNAVDGCGR
jgi:hypothetical protein